MPFTFQQLDIPEVILIEACPLRDDRGYFVETYKEPDFKAHGIDCRFVQDNHSQSRAGVLRGLHFQNNPRAQGKLIRVTSGSVFDVAVDLRKGSPTFGQYVSAILSAENARMLWIPAGFAHGVFVLEDNTQLIYKVTEIYSQAHERSLRFDDPILQIKWPHSTPIVSDKDLNAPFLNELDVNFVYM